MADASAMKWYVLRAVSGKEGKVKEFIEAAKKHNDVLEAHVGEVLLPTEKYAMLRNGKRVIKEKLFLPGYVLRNEPCENISLNSGPISSSLYGVTSEMMI